MDPTGFHRFSQGGDRNFETDYFLLAIRLFGSSDPSPTLMMVGGTFVAYGTRTREEVHNSTVESREEAGVRDDTPLISPPEDQGPACHHNRALQCAGRP